MVSAGRAQHGGGQQRAVEVRSVLFFGTAVELFFEFVSVDARRFFSHKTNKKRLTENLKMSRRAADAQEPVPVPVPECDPSPPLPLDHVLNSGAVLFPGAFDQHGCPLIMFPVESQAKLSTELSKAEVVDFIKYFQFVHNKKLEKESLVSVVADLRHASPHTVRFIAETLLLLELHKQTVHSVYIIQPKKKDVVKLLLKLLTPKSYPPSLKKVLLKDVSELSNFIDRSQLLASLGGYFIYCHQSWVAFIKEIDAFVQEFVSVVQRLPSCISTLRDLSRLPLPATYDELQHFCSTNEAKFQQLRRGLGLDELLRHCESVLEKLRHPEKEPCYLAMVGTALFAHTAFDMLQNHIRITAAVEKVELLWQQAFSKARLQLQVFQLREDALQITEKINALHREKLLPYKIEIAKDATQAQRLLSEFETSVCTPAVALVRCSEDVIHTLAETVLFDGQRDHWVLDLERLKEKLYSAVQLIVQTLRAVSRYHQNYNKASAWYSVVLHENLLQELLSGVNGGTGSTQTQRRNWGMVPPWRHRITSFLRKHPPPDTEELVHLAHLSSIISDDEVQQAGKTMSQRCMTLRKLLMSSEPVAVGHLQRALQWQYELLRSVHVSRAADGTARDVKSGKERTSPSAAAVSGPVSAEGKPPSPSSFDSGFDGAGSSQLEVCGGWETLEGLSGLAETRDSGRSILNHPQIHQGSSPSISDAADHREEFDFGSVGNSSRASIQIVPKAATESLNFEIKVKRSAALPSNPWLSLPIDNLENSYTITVTPNPTPQKNPPEDPADPCTSQPIGCRDQPTQTEVSRSVQSGGSVNRDWFVPSQSTLQDPIYDILSSTITEERDKSMCTTDGVPTLLWDSYDLHEQNQDSIDGSVEISLKDWDMKEQENLREVEKILDRTDEILEKEENVLTQEAVLDALVSSESHHNRWLWDSEDQTGEMSPSEWAEAGVLGLEDLPTELENLWEPTSTASASTNVSGCENPCNRSIKGADTETSHGSLDLLTELRHVRILDKLIMEENVKIHMFRQVLNEELPSSKPPDPNRPSVSKQREVFQLQLEKEKREVGKLERSLEEECQVKIQKDSTEVGGCSIMEKAESEEQDDQALCDELLSGSSHKSRGINSSPVVCSDSRILSEDSCKTAHVQSATDPDGVTEDGLRQAHYSEAEPSVLKTSASEPQQCVASENATKPEASLSPEKRPDDGAFDPGGSAQCTPVSKPRKVLFLVKDNLVGDGIPDSTELTLTPHSVSQDPVKEPLAPPSPETSAVDRSLVLNADVEEHHKNNNNNNNQTVPEKCEASTDSLSAMTTIDKDALVVPEGLEQRDLQPAEEMRTLSPVHDPYPEASPELEHSEGEEHDEEFVRGVQNSEGLRMSGSGSPGIQTQLNVTATKMTDFKTPIVLDTGSGLMKAGFADQDFPDVVFPTIIGMPKYEEVMNGSFEREIYIGHEAQHMRGVLTLKRPIKNGIVQNWDEMEKIWHHTFLQLCVEPEDHPVLLTEPAMNPRENRQRMVEIMFECFNVPLTYVAMQAVLALYAAGRSTGVVFDSGDGVSHTVPVFDGHYLPHAVQRFPLAGFDVTMHLQKLLQEQGVCLRTTAEREIVREMKEKCCCVALNYEAELNAGGSSCREMHYTMPDGRIVTLGTERFRAPEILFKPELIGRDHCGMHESLFKSVLSSDIDLRRSLLGNIVLSGGNTLLSGLPERLQAEIKGLMLPDMGESVRVTSPKDRDFSVWSGGAVLANQWMSSMWISQEEYEEYGPQIVFRKCF